MRNLLLASSLILMSLAGLNAQAAGSNPHWTAGECTTCHNSEAPTVEALDLKTTPGYAVCSDCHDGMDAAVCRHRSDIAVTDERLLDIDDVFKVGVTDGQVGCTTCHEM